MDLLGWIVAFTFLIAALAIFAARMDTAEDDSCCRGFEPHQPPHSIQRRHCIRRFFFCSGLGFHIA